MREIKSNELKKIQLDILQVVHEFCLKNNIDYSLSFGTLLGAARHQGYIPWDDDIDIMMLRKDYDKFIKGFRHHFISVVDMNTSKDYWHPYAKVQDERTIMMEYNNMPKKIGINIDLFPVDNFPEDIKGAKRLILHKRIFNIIHNIKIIKVSKKRAIYKNNLLKLGQCLFKLIPMPKLISKLDKISRKYENYSSSWVGILAPTDNKIDWRVPNVWFSNYTQLYFEGRKFQVIARYSDYLDRIYGNWRELPPVNKQTSHHVFEAYWKI